MNAATSATDKAFNTLRARLGMRGYTLARTDGRDGRVRYYVGFRGYDRGFASLHAVEAFARQIGVK